PAACSKQQYRDIDRHTRPGAQRNAQSDQNEQRCKTQRYDAGNEQHDESCAARSGMALWYPKMDRGSTNLSIQLERPSSAVRTSGTALEGRPTSMAVRTHGNAPGTRMGQRDVRVCSRDFFEGASSMPPP